MRFKFSLETLLRIRKLEQSQAQRAVQEALRAVDILDSRIAEVEAERLAARQYAAPAVGAINVGQMLASGRFDLQLQLQIKELQHQKSQLMVEVERRRDALRQADSKVRQLERLKESAFERHQHAEGVKAQRELDEIASQLFQRRQS